MLRALVSIHDLMPATRGRVTRMLETLAREVPGLPASRITLLVVPGGQWQEDDLDWLRSLARAGHPLAGHGWSHQAVAEANRSAYHRWHSRLLSRNVAEHLSRTPDEVAGIIRDCARWFPRQDLPEPTLYVPPAWAPGQVPAEAWQDTRFSMMETLHGVGRVPAGAFRSLPLVGYEADTGLRALFLTMFNRWSLLRARQSGAPVRIGLHPFDLDLKLGGKVVPHLREVDRFETYDQLWQAADPAQPSWSSR